MPITTFSTQTTAVPDDYICDCCGKEYSYDHNAVTMNHTFGYFSDHDMKTVSFVVCENCFHDVVKNNMKTALWT